jgi:hypothetical protein
LDIDVVMFCVITRPAWLHPSEFFSPCEDFVTLGEQPFQPATPRFLSALRRPRMADLHQDKPT